MGQHVLQAESLDLGIPSWFPDGKCANDQAVLDWTRNSRGTKGERRDFFHDKETAKMAKKYCQDCPFKEACLTFALQNLDAFSGVMGGTTHRERKAFLKRQTKNLHESVAKIEARMKELLQDKELPTAS